MVDLQTILATHHPKTREKERNASDRPNQKPNISEIPDVFFDDVLVNYKLNRVEAMVLMYLYRQVWCRPNLYKEYGLSQILSHTEISKSLKISLDDVYHALRNLESLSLIETIRSGQYFLRKFFTEENDQLYGQRYDDF